MKILFITDNFPPEVNASASRVFERAKYWLEWGHEVTVITSCPNFPDGILHPSFKNRWYQVENMEGVTVKRVKTYISPNRGIFRRIFDFISFLVTSFVAGILQKKHDVVVATSPQFFAAVSGWLIGFFRGTPFVFELGDLWPASVTALGVMKRNWGLKVIEWLELTMYRSSTKVVALTDSFKKNLVQRGIDPHKIDVVRNGVDLRKYAPREKSQTLLAKYNLENKFVVGYMGTHGAAHALENVVHAANILKNHEHINFVFMGSGAGRKSVCELVKKLNLSNVTLIDPRPKSEMPEHWSLLDISLVHLKNTQLFATVIPSKMFEAMGMGLPILLSAPKGEASRIVEETGAGVWIEPENPELLAATVLELSQNRENLKKLAQQSQKSAPLFTREEQARKVIQSLEAAVSSTQTATSQVLESK